MTNTTSTAAVERVTSQDIYDAIFRWAKEQASREFEERNQAVKHPVPMYEIIPLIQQFEAQAREEGRAAGRVEAIQREYDRGCPAPCHCEKLQRELGIEVGESNG